MPQIGIPELLVILAIALLIFGPRRLGDVGKGLGEGVRALKSAISGEKEVAGKKEVATPEEASKEEADKQAAGETKQS